MPSSVKVGVRPMSATSRAYSSGLSPCATASASSTLGSVSLKGLRSFSLGETLGPLAFGRCDLKSGRKIDDLVEGLPQVVFGRAQDQDFRILTVEAGDADREGCSTVCVGPGPSFRPHHRCG